MEAKAIEANVIDKVHDMFEQVMDTSSLQNAISSLETKFAKLETQVDLKLKGDQSEVKSLGLKIDRVDLKLDTCQD